ncbi:hypothetical protein AKO1_001424 [Acrasis kona]|uniref:Uncharacterized protein n=1 Tax=Acrasis kona TaxID=1008807 RepID=A0AAW2Z9S7_9EUKA
MIRFKNEQEQIKKTCSNQESTINEQKKQLLAKNDRLDQLINELRESSDHNIAVEGHLNQLQKDIENVNKQAREKSTIAQQQIDELSDAHAKDLHHIQMLNQDIDALQRDNKRLQGELKNDHSKRDLEQELNHQVDELKIRIKDLESHNQSLSQKVSNAKDEYGEQIKSLQSKNDELDKSFQSYKRRVENDKEDLKRILNEKDDHLDQFKSTIDRQKNEIEKSKKRIKFLEDDHDSSNQLAQLQLELDRIAADKNQLMNQNEELRNQLKNSSSPSSPSSPSSKLDSPAVTVLKQNIEDKKRELNDLKMGVVRDKEMLLKQSDVFATDLQNMKKSLIQTREEIKVMSDMNEKYAKYQDQMELVKSDLKNQIKKNLETIKMLSSQIEEISMVSDKKGTIDEVASILRIYSDSSRNHNDPLVMFKTTNLRPQSMSYRSSTINLSNPPSDGENEKDSFIGEYIQSQKSQVYSPIQSRNPSEYGDDLNHDDVFEENRKNRMAQDDDDNRSLSSINKRPRRKPNARASIKL